MNNRIIKFRVWDFILGKFDDQIYRAGEQFGHPSSCDWVAQQFTGLKDKNNKEIYEGDILKWKHPMEDIGFCEFIVNQNFNAPYPNQCYFGLCTKKLGVCHFQEDDEYEIIGNICENPELLK